MASLIAKTAYIAWPENLEKNPFHPFSSSRGCSMLPPVAPPPSQTKYLRSGYSQNTETPWDNGIPQSRSTYIISYSLHVTRITSTLKSASAFYEVVFMKTKAIKTGMLFWAQSFLLFSIQKYINFQEFIVPYEGGSSRVPKLRAWAE